MNIFESLSNYFNINLVGVVVMAPHLSHEKLIII